MQFRPAVKSDVSQVVDLAYSAGPELYEFVYQASSNDARAYIRFEFESGRGFCGYNNVTVAERDGRVVACGCFYDGRDYRRLEAGTVANIFRYYGLIGGWAVLRRALHVGSVMAAPKKRELYLANFGVAADARGGGIGAAMLAHHIKAARSADYQIFSLDVADNNPRAEALYARTGLQVVEKKRFSGKRDGFFVPNAKKMELALSG